MSDPYSAQTVLLLPMEGDNNSTVFSDRSFKEATVTRYGDTKILTAQGKWGNGSGYFDGTGDYFTVAHPDLALGTGDFTVEQWVWRSSSPSGDVDSLFHLLSGTGINFEWSTGNHLALYLHAAPAAYAEGTTAFNLSAWNHVALSRSAGVFYGFLNGELQFSITASKNFSTTTFYIGRDSTQSARDFGPGYMNDVRITQGVARYTATFTPPTARLPDPDPPSAGILSFGYASDVVDGGAYRVTGTVDELGVPGRYRVRLFDRTTGRLVREVWSAADGTYAFLNLAYRERGYFVIAYDHGDNPHNAAIADLMTPEAMP